MSILVRNQLLGRIAVLCLLVSICLSSFCQNQQALATDSRDALSDESNPFFSAHPGARPSNARPGKLSKQIIARASSAKEHTLVHSRPVIKSIEIQGKQSSATEAFAELKSRSLSQSHMDEHDRLDIATTGDNDTTSNSKVVVSRESTGSVPATNSTEDSLVVTRESKGTSPPPNPEADSLVVPRETTGAIVPADPEGDSLVVPREQAGSSVPINPTQDSLVVSRESKSSASQKKRHSALVIPRNDKNTIDEKDELVTQRYSSPPPHQVAQHTQMFKAPALHFFSQNKTAISGASTELPNNMSEDPFGKNEPLARLPLPFPSAPINSLSTGSAAATAGTGLSASKAAAPGQIAAETPETARMRVLEERLFSRTFDQDNPQDRIGRLEHFVLGVEGKGEIAERLDKLNKIFKSVTPDTTDGTTDATAKITSKPESKPKALLAVINDGIDNYNKHRFHNAEDNFNDALALAPGMSRVHAYLGVTLLQLNQRQAALDAMNAAYELDPFGTYGRYAKNCLITLMGDEEVRKRGPRDDLKTVERTLNSVNHQADSDSNRYRREGNIQADHMRFAIHDSNWMPNQVGIRRDYIHTDWTVQSTRVRQDAAKRAEYAQESANNLKMLLSTKLMPGDAKLRALGTTLHARYYGDETYNLAPYYIPREAPMELKAQPLSLKSMRTAATNQVNRNTKKTVTQKNSRSNKQNRR